jgi:hypothetical protein
MMHQRAFQISSGNIFENNFDDPIRAQLLELNLGGLDALYVNGGANALFTSASQRASSSSMQEVVVVVVIVVVVVVEVVVVIMLLLQVQNSTRTVVTGIRSALDASNAQSLTEISLLQNSTVAIISSMSAAIARIFADSAVQLSLFKNTTTFLLDDVYGDFVALAAESDAEQKKVLNATDFLVADINDNTKYSLASAGASSAAAIIAAIVILLYVGVSLCQHCATWRFDRRVREAQKRGEISMHSKGTAEMTEDA